MRSWIDKLEKWFSAVAFAEEGEHKTALELARLNVHEAPERVGAFHALRNAFAAAAFAEENCHEIAREILNRGKAKKGFLETLGLKGVRVWYGHVPLPQETFLEIVGLSGARVRFGVLRL